MKRKLLIATVLLAGVVITGGLAMNKTEASSLPEQQAEMALSQYLEAASTGNVDDLMRLSKDLRYSDETVRKQEYESIAKADPVESKILNLKKIDDTHFSATVRAKTKAGTHQIDLPVVKDGDAWKVLINGEKVDKN